MRGPLFEGGWFLVPIETGDQRSKSSQQLARPRGPFYYWSLDAGRPAFGTPAMLDSEPVAYCACLRRRPKEINGFPLGQARS